MSEYQRHPPLLVQRGAAPCALGGGSGGDLGGSCSGDGVVVGGGGGVCVGGDGGGEYIRSDGNRYTVNHSR